MVPTAARAARKMTPISPSDVRGFTLLEILTVLAILALAVTLVVPDLDSIGARRFDAQVREAVGVLNNSRRLAVIEGRPGEVALLNSSAEVEQQEPDSGAEQYRFDEGIRLAWRENEAARPEDRERIALRFYPEGGASGGDVIVSSPSRQALIHVDPFSARVSSEVPEERIR